MLNVARNTIWESTKILQKNSNPILQIGHVACTYTACCWPHYLTLGSGLKRILRLLPLLFFLFLLLLLLLFLSYQSTMPLISSFQIVFNSWTCDCDLQDVLLLYYTPWCGYCQALGPVLLTVARIFQNISDVIIARYSFRHNIQWHLVQCLASFESCSKILTFIVCDSPYLRHPVHTEIHKAFRWEKVSAYNFRQGLGERFARLRQEPFHAN